VLPSPPQRQRYLREGQVSAYRTALEEWQKKAEAYMKNEKDKQSRNYAGISVVKRLLATVLRAFPGRDSQGRAKNTYVFSRVFVPRPDEKLMRQGTSGQGDTEKAFQMVEE
ncbi:unnamed protein product, partial [Amoebophrya sp. A25]